nr:condensation domain-containing protein [uncultured bacterium]
MTMHHIVSDGWSMGILVREMAALYAAFAEGTPSPLPELPVQYTDFAVWQHSWLQGEVLEREISFWRRQLAGLPPVLELPTDRPRPARQRFRGATRPVRLPAELSRQAEVLSRREGSTLFMVLLAGFQALLARYSDQQDFAVGTPVAGRNRVEMEGLIGFFVNTLVLRADLTGDGTGGPTFGELLGRVRETALAAQMHQDLPFERLVEELAPERSLAHAPLFQVMLALQNAPAESLEIRDLLLRPLGGGGTTAKLDLTLSLAEHPDGLSGNVEYATDLFDASTIDRLIGHYERLLTAAVVAPELRVAELPLLLAAERHQVIVESNDTSVPWPEGLLLHEVVAAQAARSPDAPAIRFAEETLTYTGLALQADRLARRLYTLGCIPESRVGIALERSPDLIVALLGVLRAGAAYVPLDPGYPRERLAMVLEDAASRVLITRTSLLASLPPAPGAVLCLDTEPLDLDLDLAPDPVAAPGDDRRLAYVLYTSGSTGRPKGVGVPHRALMNFLASMRHAPGFSPQERILSVTSLSFDIAALEIFLPLTTGGCIELASREETADGALLAARLRASGASMLQATPATWRMLLEAGWSGDHGLRALCGGEALSRELASSLAGRTRELWNLYGPTETTVWSAAARLEPGEAGPVSIGRPITNTRIHLLDREMQPVALGVPGELWIGGSGLARGYLGRPDLTAERFLPDPFAAEAGEPGGRLYRTGDLARRLPGSRMEVLGRIDHQVKIRGFRIELGEIEAALSTVAGVRDAVAAVREDAPGDRRLVAYVTGDATAEEMRRSLRERLPDYMIPAAFVPLAALPLTPNGKVDRKALPAPDHQDSREGDLAPRTPVEELLAGIWAEVLGLERVGAAGHFFDLGGHSLLATRVMVRVRSVFGVEIPLRDLFEAPTLAGFAERIEAARQAGAGSQAPPLGPVERPERLPLSFAQERLWFLDRLQPNSPFYNLPMAVEVRGNLSVPALAASLNGVVRRHEVLRTAFPFVAGIPVQLIAPVLDVAPLVVDLGSLPGTVLDPEVARLTRILAVQPFDLATGPLLRSALLHLTPERHVVLFSMHHIVTDGWSMALLIQEVAELCRAATLAVPSALPGLPIQYADFALWQRAWLSEAILEEQTAWWRRALAGAPHVLDLPTDLPRPAVQSLHGAHAVELLPSGLARDLQELSVRQNVTPFMTQLALFGALLQRYTGAEDLLIGSPIAGRNHAEVERLIGLFVNTLVLRVEMEGDPVLVEVLGRVRERTLGAYAHQDLPFEKLVEELHPTRSLAHTPLFQVMLVQQNAPVGSAVEIPGLRFLPLPATSGTARFDLHLALTEIPSGLLADVEYNRDLFDPATITRLLGHLRLLAEGAVRNPQARLSGLPLLSDGESHQIRLGWNDTQAQRRTGLTLPALFAQQVARTPEAPAVTFEHTTLSYRELDRISGRLAARLLDLGVQPDTAVGVLIERSVEMVAALLALLKAGAAYLPLDPEYPAERLGWILGDARVSVLLAQERLLPALPSTQAHVLCLEAGWEGDGEPGSRTGLSDQSLAYVLYTSGSTGKPKGVMIPHQGIVNRLLWMQETYGLTREDRVLQKTAYSFDVSVWEFFWPLITGAHLVVARPGGHRDGAYLAELIRRERVTVLHFVPSMLQAFLEEPDLCGCASLRLVVASGETLTPELRRRFGERLNARLENLYGPTEASVDVTSWNCATEARGGIVPIGRPVANTRIHLLDRALSPVPIGIPGELSIGGMQLARGYFNRPDLTAERFVPAPGGEGTGDRLYRTGDLARFLPDGAVEYLGRLDFQVKIRGFRIELGEIEAVLASHPAVRDAVVLARAEGAGDRSLVAYIVPRHEAACDISELRAFLAAQVPEHMLPPAWVMLNKLPLTPSGKVDRKALPAPGAAAARDSVAPRSPLEQVLAGIWAELLKVERVGLADNFFDLGGDSIKAVRLVSRVNERLGADLRVQDVFKHQTVGPLAERIATRSDWSQADDLAAGRAEIERLQHAVLSEERQRAKLPEEHEDFFPLSGVEKGMVYYTLLLPEQPIYHDQHIYVLSIPDLDCFYRALALVMGRHPILRSTFHLDAFEEPMKVVLRSVPVVRNVEDLSGLPAAEQRERIERYRAEDLRHKFTFRGEILWRLKLFRLEADTFVTVWTWHHAILDGWSNLTFWLDLNELLAREDLDRIESVPPLASSYKDYLAITLGRRRSPATEAFWRATLADAGRNKLPFHRAATRERAAFGMRSLYRPLRRELLLGLRERAAELHLPLQALFLAAHLHLLRVTSGEEDVITGVVSHDRPGIPDGDKIVGCFLNTFPLRLRLEPGETGASLARRVARFLATEKEHEIPLVDIAGIVGARESAQNPIFDTLLNFMDFHLIEEVRENVLFRPMTGQDSGQATRELPDLQSDEMTNTLFDLEVSATPVNPFLRLKYLPRHFERGDIERALAVYDRILETLAGDLDAPLAAQALLSEEEQGQLVAAYNDTARDYPRERPLHSFFEERAALHPDLPAVLCGGSSLTYGELDRLANRVARLLLARGVQPGDNVGVCLERSPELVATLFGVLKAGAAYVPLEPSYPPTRKDYIARQSAISFLLDRLPEDLAAFSDAPVPVRPRPDDLAYTIYTSGSTGTPKGVLIEHHSAVNLIGWVNREMAVGPEDRVLMVSSVCFDLSVYDVFGTLAAGGTVVVARQEEVQEPAALLRLLVERGITFWNSVPSTLGLLVQYLEETDPGFRGEDLRIAFLSGDWIPLALPERARRFFPRVISWRWCH